jgi:hypothetical protein
MRGDEACASVAPLAEGQAAAMDQVRAGRAIGTKAVVGAAAAALLLLAALPAAAQFGGGRGGGQRGQQQQQPPSSSTTKPSPGIPEPWPRLESGALLCKSRDDLVTYQKKIAGGAGIVAAQQATGCHSIRKQTAIQILDRDGPSRTEIVTSDDAKETGWTNTFLPDQKPGN